MCQWIERGIGRRVNHARLARLREKSIRRSRDNCRVLRRWSYSGSLQTPRDTYEYCAEELALDLLGRKFDAHSIPCPHKLRSWPLTCSATSIGASSVGESGDRRETSSESDTRNRTIGVTSRKDSVDELSDIEASAESASGSVARRAAPRCWIK